MAFQLPPGVDPCTIPAAKNPNGEPPNFTNPESLSTATIAVASVMLILTTMFVGARIWANRLRLRWSDYFTMVAYTLQTGFTGIIISLNKYNRHLWDIPVCFLDTSYLKRIYAHTLLFGFTLFFSKAAIFLLYLEIFGTQRRTRYFIWGGLAAAAVLYVTFLPFASIFDAPAAGQSWEDLFAQISDLARAKVILDWSLVIGSGSILLDVYIFALPIPILAKLHTSKAKRLQLFVVFGTALLGVVASIVGLAYRVYLITDPLDSTWHTSAVALANMIENDVAIIVGSMPAFSTFFRDRVAGGSLWRSFASALRSNKDSTSKGSMMDKYWRSSGKSPYTLTSRSRSDADIELTGIHVVSEGGPTKIGVDVTGIVRTVDISQQVHTRPESTRNLF